MRAQNWLVVSLLCGAAGFGCSAPVLSSTGGGSSGNGGGTSSSTGGGTSGTGGGTSSGTGGGSSATGGGTSGTGGGTAGTGGGAQDPYPPGPYGVGVNRVIANFSLPGYFTTGNGVKVNTLPKMANNDLQAVREATDANGNKFKYLLLDISAGWCPPCNAEAKDLGLTGSHSTLIKTWQQKGGLFMTVLTESYDESTHAPPVDADPDTWINTNSSQSSVVYDPQQNLLTAGIDPNAFPTNLVIDLRTMKIVAGWPGVNESYPQWEAVLAQ
jgi:hypothetical protein